MDLAPLLQLVLHPTVFLSTWLSEAPLFAYALLGLIIFAETGLVIFPFLPGDSLLFTAGALLSATTLNPSVLGAFLVLCAWAGDTLNYGVGRQLRAYLLSHPRWMNPKHLESTQNFYKRHGKITLFVARFVPIVRTFAPCVAGLSRMGFLRFWVISFLAATLWIGTLLGAGFCLGNIPFVQQHFSLILILIVLLSLVPTAVSWIRHARQR